MHKTLLSSPRLVEPFTKYGFTSDIHFWTTLEEEGNIEELKDYSGIMFHMYFGDNLPTYGVLIQRRPRRDQEGVLDKKTGKKIRLTGWRKRGWDGITRILYSLELPLPYKPIGDFIDFFLQIAIDLIQRGFLTGPDCILRNFRKYTFNKFKGECHKKVLHQRSDPLEKSKDYAGEKYPFRTSRTKVWAKSNRAPLEKRSSSIDLDQVDDNVLKETLVHIVKKFNPPSQYNPTSSEVFVRRTLYGKIQDKIRKIYGTPKRSYYQPKPTNTEKEMRRELISIRKKTSGKSEETSKRWVDRKRESGWSLEEIYHMLK